MDKVCLCVHQAQEHLSKSKDDLMDEDLFPTNYTISKETEEDATFDSDLEGDDKDEREEADFTVEEDDSDVYEVDDEWGTLVTDDSKGIFKAITEAVAKRTPKMLHDFAWLAFVCSV
jgi:hypothetical protein